MRYHMLTSTLRRAILNYIITPKMQLQDEFILSVLVEKRNRKGCCYKKTWILKVKWGFTLEKIIFITMSRLFILYNDIFICTSLCNNSVTNQLDYEDYSGDIIYTADSKVHYI